MKNKIVLYLFALSGFLIISYSVFIFFISSVYTYAAGPTTENVVFFSLTRIFLGVIYTFIVFLVLKKRLSGKKVLLFIFSTGLIARIILVPSEPILEDDFNRYLWDGAVTANGYNTFKYSPSLFFQTDSTENIKPQKLVDLAKESGNIINLINYPHIRTIYPPVAQAAFAIAYFIKPWSTTIWKGLLLLFDLIVFYLLIQILKKLKYSPILIIIYWWNPILLHEIFNAGHMDLVMYPLLVGSILFYLNEKYILSILLVTLAVGVKIWPIILLPLIIKKVWNNKKLLLIALSVSALIILIILYPIIISKLDNSLGFVTYSKNWTNNESVFQLLNILVKQIIELFNISYHCSLCVARWITIIFFGGLIIFFILKMDDNKYKFTAITFLLISVMYFISPTQFPWYYTWVLPFLVLNPRLSFVAYSIFLPLYQLKYSWPFLVWIEHLPVLACFIWELYSTRARRILKTMSGY
ncbi:MAG: hypothetical protein OQJ81_10845 [Melioribacteraceae bacterium]|nr:hypothetical protein [Melioribacteraceae bacterium]